MKKIFCPFESYKKGNIHGKSWLFPSRFSTRNSVNRTCFTRFRGAQFEHVNYFLKLNFYLGKYKSLSLHVVNNPSTKSLLLLPTDFRPDAVAVRHSLQIGMFWKH